MLTVNSGKTNYYKIKLKKARKVKLTLKSMCTNYIKVPGKDRVNGGYTISWK